MKKHLIFWTWLPLALSFTFMMLEGPVQQTAVARLPDATLQLAAIGMIMSLSITIESPVIMLLSTGIALGRNQQAFRVLRRMVLGMNLALTALTILIAFTPLYDALTRGLLGVPAAVAEAGRLPLRIMTLWTFVIGQRRFYQGLLVRYDRSRMLSIGTGIRLGTILLLAPLLLAWGQLPGAVAGAVIVMTGVTAELIATAWFVRPVIRRHLSQRDPGAAPLTYGAVLRFHAPLAGTSVLTLLVNPIIAAALARLENPTVSLAAWPIIFTLLLVLRGAALTMQEVTIALARQHLAADAIRRFTLTLAAVLTALTALLTFTPLLDTYLVSVATLPAPIAAAVRTGLWLGLLVPALTALLSWLRGVLVGRGATTDVNWAMAANVLVTVVALLVGVALRMPAVPLAAVTLTLALAAETAFLYWRTLLPARVGALAKA